MIILYRHHTVSDFIEFDDQSGLWRPAVNDKDNPFLVGLMAFAKRVDYDIRGSYTIENEKRYYLYWNDTDELVFRTDEQRYVWFRRGPDGGLVDLMGGASVELQAATYGDGRTIPNASTFSVTAPGGERIVEVTYNSQRYIEYYMGNPTFVPDENLSDWDFFVAVKAAVEDLRKLCMARSSLDSHRHVREVSIEPPLVAESGSPAPQSGTWAAIHHLNERCWLEEGESVPDIDGRPDSWVWVDA